MRSDYELVVIGGGSAGMSAARTAARRGAHALLAQSGPIGGECTFTGCVPSKALIAAAAAGQSFAAAMDVVRRSIATIAATEDDEAFAAEGVEVVHGWVTFRSPTELEVAGRPIRTGRVVIATGTRPALPEIIGIDTVDVLTNENVFDLDTQPGTLAVLGGGPVGCELAQAFARLGTQVTVVEALRRLLPREDPQASAVVAEVFANEGISVRCGARVTRAEPVDPKGAARLCLEDGSTIEAERLLVAVGRRPATARLGLDAARVATDRGFVVTDDHLASTASGIWAAGDVTGKLAFTHVADEMGRIAAANALSGRWRRQRFNSVPVPWVIFTDPEVAHVGMLEAEAASRTRGAQVAFLPMHAVDRAIVSSKTAGFVKLIAGPRRLLRSAGGGQVLGATIVAARAGELIHEPALAMRTRMFTGRLAQTVHAYPTWSVAVRETAAQFFFEVEGRKARPARPDGDG